MKNLLFLLLTLGAMLHAITLVAQQQKPAAGSKSPSAGHHIRVKVPNYAGDTVMLAYHYGAKQYLKDTAQVVNGEAVFQGKEPLPRGIYMVVFPPKNTYFELIMSDDQDFSVETDTTDFNLKMKVNGCKENEIFYADIRFLDTKRKEMESYQRKKDSAAAADKPTWEVKVKAVNDDVIAYRKKLVTDNPAMLYSMLLKSMEEPETPKFEEETDPQKRQVKQYYYYRDHYFDNINFADTSLLRSPVLESKMNYYMDKLTIQAPDSIAAGVDFIIKKYGVTKPGYKFSVITLLNKYANSKVMCMDRLYVHIVEKYYLNGKADWTDEETLKKMQERVYFLKPCLCGEKAENVITRDSTDTFRALHDIKKQYTILYFWDYECGHCKTVTPKLVEFFNTYAQASKIGLFTVNINGTKEDWMKRMREYKFPAGGIHTSDPKRESHFDQFYDIHSTPQIYILDKDHKIIAKKIGVEQLGEFLDHLIEDDKKRAGEAQK